MVFVERSSNQIECRYEIRENIFLFLSNKLFKKKIQKKFFSWLKRNFFIDDKALPVLPVMAVCMRCACLVCLFSWTHFYDGEIHTKLVLIDTFVRLCSSRCFESQSKEIYVVVQMLIIMKMNKPMFLMLHQRSHTTRRQ